LLGVVAPRHWIALAVLPEKRLIVPVVGLSKSSDRCVFPAGSFDQAIKRVVNIRGDAGDLLIVKEDYGNVSIFRMSDVTDRVERVSQILQWIIVRSFGFEAY
jgi:glucose/arabinose dehydrogenase